MNAPCTSYVQGYSEEWGNSTYFTYYSEFDRWWKGAGITEACVLLFIFIVSVGTNMMVIYRGIKSKLFKAVTNYFIINLAVADLTFSLTIPFIAVIRITESWIFHAGICQLIVCLQLMCGGVVIWSLVAVSISRYRSIVVPPVRRPLTTLHVFLILSAVWISPAIICIPFALQFRIMEVDCDGTTVSICTLVFPAYLNVRVSVILFTFLMIYVAIIPAGLMIYCYYRIFSKLNEMQHSRVRRRLTSSSAIPIISKPGSLSCSMSSVTLPDLLQTKSLDLRTTKSLSSLPSSPTSKLTSAATKKSNVSAEKSFVTRRFRDTLSVSAVVNIRRSRNYRAMKILLINVVAVFVMWAPMWAMLVALFLDSSKSGAKRIASHDFVYCLSVAFANSFVNAVLYGMLNGNFRQYFHLTRLHPSVTAQQTLHHTSGSKVLHNLLQPQPNAH